MAAAARFILLTTLLALGNDAWAADPPASQPARPPAAPALAGEKRHQVLHLPGVGGYLAIDRNLMTGLAAGGVSGSIEHYDWTNGDPGLNALRNQANHRVQVDRVSEMLQRRLRDHPDQPLTLIGHSGGCAIAVWALERLPAEMQIDRLILLAPALSPGYDLTAALRRVRTSAWVFSSEHDTVLGPGTRVLGTMDGVRADAAGRVGFNVPPAADPGQYRKLVPMPYRLEWVELDNAGDHIGVMSPIFARDIIAPLITGTAP